jgi:NAD(P)-dependent dehydrogenase (short-subunit alcohol dehydrogenase family)
MKSAVVTGVSSGIGMGTVAVLIRHGWKVFGSVRKESDAATFQRQFGNAFVPLVFDVQDEGAIAAAVEVVRTAMNGETLDGLVNNAGSSFENPLLVQSVADFRTQIEVNLVGMFAVTRAFAPMLGADSPLSGPKGRIVNISSVGGKFGPPFLGAYAASKHGVEGFSESLRRELLLVGIDVIVVGPGSVKTAIWDKAEAKPVDHLKGTVWEKPFRNFQDYMIKGGRNGMEAEEVGEIIANALTVAQPKTRYAAVKGKFVNVTIPSLLPKRFVDRLLAKQLGLVRE